MDLVDRFGPSLIDLAQILMEDQVPFFEADDLHALLRRNGDDLRAAAYEGLVRKAMESQVTMSGLTLPDTSKYFLRIAQRYRPFNSGILEGG